MGAKPIWKTWSVIVQLTILLVGLSIISTHLSAAEPASEAPYTGTYYCYTTALESDRYANNPIAVRPAPFGKLILDGKGGYTLTAKAQKGSYVFEPRQGKLSFTGTLSTMQVSGYAPDSFKLNYRGAGGTYAFNCTTDGAGDGRSLKKAKPENVQRLVAGRFSGEYLCPASEKVAVDIQLSSDDDNNLKGTVVLRFGGKSSTRPPAKYAVMGRWFKEADFTIKPDYWLENPEKLTLPGNWMTGQVEEGGLTHIKTSDSCPNFSLIRAG
jgi:hypothetical protein